MRRSTKCHHVINHILYSIQYYYIVIPRGIYSLFSSYDSTLYTCLTHMYLTENYIIIIITCPEEEKTLQKFISLLLSSSWSSTLLPWRKIYLEFRATIRPITQPRHIPNIILY